MNPTDSALVRQREITWQDLVDLEPRLRHLDDLAKHLAGRGDTWRNYEALKHMAGRLVGHCCKSRNEMLVSSEAYELVVAKLLATLERRCGR